MTHAWPARFGGRCNECGRSFKVGTMVCWEGGRIVEAECPPREDNDAGMSPEQAKAYSAKMCLRCFTVHAVGQRDCE